MAQFLTQFLIDFWATLSAMAPYLLFGFLVAGLLSVWIKPATVRRYLGKKGFGSVAKASLFGIPLPLCSCGVIPLSMSLYKHGASKGATTSFLLATPQTNVYSFLVTYSLLGPVMAIIRPIAAMATGLLGGGLVELTEDNQPPAQTDALPKDDSDSNNAPHAHWLVRALRHGFVVLPTDIGRAMLIGLTAAALLSAVLPEDFFVSYLAGGDGIVAKLVMLAVGIPIYACSTASIPVALMMIDKGLSPGAAMVFLIAGPTANAAALTTIWSMLGRRSLIAYLTSIVVCALAAGIIIDRFVFVGGFDPVGHCHNAALPTWLTGGIAAAMLAVLGVGVYRKIVKNRLARSIGC